MDTTTDRYAMTVADARFTLDATEDAAWLTGWVDSPELAREIAATFPKSVKMRGGAVGGAGPDYRNPDGSRRDRGYLRLQLRLRKDGVNGGVNEAGIKRLRSALKTIEKHGYSVEYKTSYANSVTRERLDEKLNEAA